MLSSDMNDQQVARLVQTGDRQAFGTLVERYGAKLLRYARKFLFDHEDAEDQVQEAFIKAYTNIQGFDPARQFSPWMYRIAHNQFITAIKKRGREPVAFVDLDVFVPHLRSDADPGRDADRAEMRAMLDRGLSALGPKYREPLVLYYYEEMDYREIADILRIPVSTVGVRLLRAKAALADAVAKLDPTYGHH
jgi:RNA polymerase sigma-70 factor (ECF subfamily)